MTGDEVPPAVSIVGRKNSGKTTLLVALAAELKRRGRRVATLKHGHHAFEMDQPGRDTWRHFQEGGAEAVTMVAEGKVALVMRTDGEPDPQELIQRFYGGLGYDVVLVEGYKHGPFSRIEVLRRAVHDRPLHDAADREQAGRCIAMVTDADPADVPGPWATIPLDTTNPAGTHVQAVADLVERWFLGDANAR
jgi:molybdopterin-guanine dinucleotide biosynthesis protein MobB